MEERLIDRLKKAFDARNYKDLSAKLDTNENTIKSWVNRNSYDIPLIVSKCDQNISLNWLLRGDGKMTLSGGDTTAEPLKPYNDLTSEDLKHKDDLIKRLENELKEVRHELLITNRQLSECYAEQIKLQKDYIKLMKAESK
ncbi:helix-turn-helix domain-containing protein [Carboxylicivirga sp. RSCT41]|uniref:helix-turn-helix domain-containing protein n=1 Tax=Carboxylicivirga agarovorans TaxID=3417570 RepID=UPI003D334234